MQFQHSTKLDNLSTFFFVVNSTEQRIHCFSVGSAHADEIKQLEIQVELATAQRAEFEEEAQKARQEAQDAQEDVRIAERRIQTVTADLRRQLRVERRRADKLQERLRDFVTDNPLPKSDNSIDHDNCSVSSWSLMSGQNEGHTATPSSPFPPTVTVFFLFYYFLNLYLCYRWHWFEGSLFLGLSEQRFRKERSPPWCWTGRWLGQRKRQVA